MIRKWILKFLRQWETCPGCKGTGVMDVEWIDAETREVKGHIKNVEFPMCNGWTFRRVNP
jgi:hypothetical protein